MTNAALYVCSSVGGGYYWDGSLFNNWAAIHLGISSGSTAGVGVGYVVTSGSCNNDHQSWGFGHIGWVDNQQGWGWNSSNLGSTVFRIGVR